MIKHCFYINLDRKEDRRKFIESELNKSEILNDDKVDMILISSILATNRLSSNKPIQLAAVPIQPLHKVQYCLVKEG